MARAKLPAVLTAVLALWSSIACATTVESIDRMSIVSRAFTAGTSISRSRSIALELPNDAREAIEGKLAAAIPDCAKDAAVTFSPMMTTHAPDSSEARLQGIGIYLDLSNSTEKGFAGNSIYPFVSYRVSARYADGSGTSAELFDFERLELPPDRRLTVREVEESNTKDLSQLLVPFFTRGSSKWREGALNRLCK